MAGLTIEKLLVSEIRETMAAPANGATSFSLADSNTFYLNYNPGTTISLTNVDTTPNGIVTVTFISPLGTQSTPTTLNINGTARTVKWAGGAAPSSGGGLTLLSFSIITIDNTISAVLGARSSFA